MSCPHGDFAAGECPRCWDPLPVPRSGRATAMVFLAVICLAVTVVQMSRTPSWVPALQGLALFAVVAVTFRAVSAFYTWTRSGDDA